MIHNDSELQLTLEQLSKMHRLLASLRADFEKGNPKRFALYAEGPLEEIKKLRQEID
jgi:hypothetical protein